MDISANFKNLREEIPANVKIVTVSKFQPAESIKELYDAGCRVFGENKAQEISQKQPLLPKDIEWHFIGHLQTNKVKMISPFVNTVHSIDSIRILNELNKEALKHKRIIKCLLQFHIASEENKFGLDMAEAEGLLNSELYYMMDNINIVGVMGMATFTDDMNLVRKEFATLRGYFDKLKEKYFQEDNEFKEISMGMTQDYKIAIEEGSTLLRIGSAIFN